MYDPQTNTYYEVKHRSNACKMLAVKQMHNYTSYKIHDSRFSEMTLYDNAIAIPGTININGSFAYGDWYVEYSLESPGLITYTYERMKEQENYNYAYNYYHVGVWDKMENKLPIAFSMFAVISIVYSVCSYGERPILFTKD